MARKTNIKLRRSATAGAIPTTSNLDLGELALNTNDGKLYMKTTEGSLDSVIQIGSSTDSYFKYTGEDMDYFENGWYVPSINGWFFKMEAGKVFMEKYNM